jgi:hypothetical protein
LIRHGHTHAIEAVSIHTRSARLACLANPRHPLDAHAISDLDSRGIGSRAHLDDLAYALVPADLAGLCGEGQDLPRVEHDAHVGVADAGVGSSCVVSMLLSRRRELGEFNVCWEVGRSWVYAQVDQDLSRARFGDIELLDLGRYRAGLVIDSGLVFLRDLDIAHYACSRISSDDGSIQSVESTVVGTRVAAREAK